MVALFYNVFAGRVRPVYSVDAIAMIYMTMVMLLLIGRCGSSVLLKWSSGLISPSGRMNLLYLLSRGTKRWEAAAVIWENRN